jgi:hypothetical protein
LSTLPQSGSLPQHLTRLILPDLSWSGNNLALLFAVLARRAGDRPIFVNVSRAKLADEQWADFDRFLQDFTFAGLQGLVFRQPRRLWSAAFARPKHRAADFIAERVRR